MTINLASKSAYATALQRGALCLRTLFTTITKGTTDASGASNATVSASNDLKVDASGASKISYTGEPKNIKQNSSGASSVTKK